MTLSDYLAAEGLKPSQFAERLGMPASTILRIISGKREARIGTAARIVEGTGGKVGFADLVIEPAAAAEPRSAA
ncbi:helix-turn-helix domain-containing protein [Methylorubrum thiocyanatum]|uniref:helix-turn-helix domain-containing protein n=1 Tax=Methylorubrum thiocyanatum TaxID=47958 RepID=UPI0035C8764D